MIILIIVVLLLLFGGGGYWGYRGGYYGGRGFGGILGLLLIVLILFLLFGPAHAQSGNNPFGSGVFAPNFGTGGSINATTTSASATLTGQAVNDTEVVFYNSGTTVAFVRIGTGAQTATAAGMFLPPGSIQTLYKGRGNETIAAVMDSGTAKILFITGFGR